MAGDFIVRDKAGFGCKARVAFYESIQLRLAEKLAIERVRCYLGGPQLLACPAVKAHRTDSRVKPARTRRVEVTY